MVTVIVLFDFSKAFDRVCRVHNKRRVSLKNSNSPNLSSIGFGIISRIGNKPFKTSMDAFPREKIRSTTAIGTGTAII